MIVNKFGFIASFLSFLMLASISMGFDLYAHGVIFYFYEYILNPADLLFNEIVLPRYLLLSYIFEITRRLGIPLGVVSLILIVYPTYNIAATISRINNTNLNIINSGIIMVVFLLSFFYSGLSLTLLWLIALLITKKKIFLMGALFHPVGLVLVTIFILVTRIFLFRYFFMLFIFFITLYMLTAQSFFTSSKLINVRTNLNLNLNDLIIIGERVFESKINEIIGLGVILICAFVTRTKLKFLIYNLNNIYIKKIYILTGVFLLLIFVNLLFVIKDSHSLLIDIFQFNISDPIYATWFDWGERDLADSFQSLYNKRYHDRKQFLD